MRRLGVPVMNETVFQKEQRLYRHLKQFDSAAVALSGGADSALLCCLAVEAMGKARVTALTASGSMVPQEELQAAAMLCGRLGIPHVVLPAEEFSVDAFRFNRKDRCYHCKKNIMTTFLSYAKEHHIDTVLDGTNADDLGEDRPGLKAAAELSVGKPLADCGVTKQEVYLLLERFGLTDYIKPSMSCLATRFPVGEELTKEKLARCWELEKKIRQLGVQGYMRARMFGDAVKIEAKKEEQIKIVSSHIKQEAEKLGFKTVLLELE